MKCNICGSDMISQTGGNYYCPKCGFAVNDLVYRPQSCDMPLSENFGVRYGWICPRCGKVNSPDARSCDCSSGGATITTNTDGEKRIEYIINQMPDNMEITCNTKTIEYKPCFTTVDVKDTNNNIWHWTFDVNTKE